MAGFGGGHDPANRAGEVDVAELFRPDVVFGHEGEPPECPEPSWRGDTPSGFLEHFPVQRGQRAFASVYPAARKLELGHGPGLVGEQDVVAERENCVYPRPQRVFLVVSNWIAVSPDHGFASVAQTH